MATVVSPALAADPTGDWKVADGVATIRVAQCNGNMWGAVSWEKTPGGKDKNNPDPAKQSRPTLGMPILIDMKKKAGTDAWEGQVYNAKDGQLYSSTIKPVGTDQLEIQGCVLGFLRRRDLDLRRSADPDERRRQPGRCRQPGCEGHCSLNRLRHRRPQVPAPATKPGQKQAAGGGRQCRPTPGDICLFGIARPTH